ncbi:MAG: LytTR family DNA-binding domain-containing protein [Thermoflexaceae bacterium]|nr:LytTR family DNA-binding domain-containing protein [Thermoflexaceae bacterium]
MKNPIFYIAVCDDEPEDREFITRMAGEILRQEKIHAEISCFANAKELLQELKDGKQYDLFLLDVMMPEQGGMELARELRREEMESSIIFVSSNMEMALQGYEVSAARYLAKPVDEGRLKEALLYCYGQKLKSRELLLPTNGSMRKVASKDIYYIEIMGRKCRIRQERKEWDTSLSMEELEGMLVNQGFIRCHQSFLVNCRYVRDFRTSSMELTDGRNVPVSKHRLKEVRQAFFEYVRN